MRFFANQPDEYEDKLLQKIEAILSNMLSVILLNPEHSHYIVVTEPQPDHLYRPARRIASDYVFKLLWEKQIKSRIQVMADVYYAFSTVSSFASAAGWVFKHRIHQLLGAGREIKIYPVRGHIAQVNVVYNDYAATKNRNDPLHFTLVGSGESTLPDPQTAPLAENVYYRPKSGDFPGIDSWFLHENGDKTPIILIFQITQAKTDHDVTVDGLGEMDSLKLPQNFFNARWIYVVITPDGVEPNITVPINYFKSIGIDHPLPDAFEVYHYPVIINQFFSD